MLSASGTNSGGQPSVRLRLMEALLRDQDYADLYELEESLWWFAGMREVTAALLDPVCPPGPARDILDAGCATGGMLTWLERYRGGGRVTGVDFSHAPPALCRARGLHDDLPLVQHKAYSFGHNHYYPPQLSAVL